MTALKSFSCIQRIWAVVPLMFGALVSPTETAEAQARGSGAGQGRPSIAAEVVAEGLVRHTQALSFLISVEVPTGHHGYLDKGDDGFLIPLSFSFPDFEGTDVVVEMTSAPSGVRDDTLRAQVLRGRGEFAFRLVPPPGPTAEATAVLRYQICNDVTRICYPPTRLFVPVFMGRGGGWLVQRAGLESRRARFPPPTPRNQLKAPPP